MSKPAEEVEGALSDGFAEVLNSIGGWDDWGKLLVESQYNGWGSCEGCSVALRRARI